MLSSGALLYSIWGIYKTESDRALAKIKRGEDLTESDNARVVEAGKLMRQALETLMALGSLSEGGDKC